MALAFAAVPLVGPFAAELFFGVLPNRRLERLEDMLSELGQRVAEMDPEEVRRRLMEPVFADLFDEGARQAARSGSPQRLKEIAAVLESGLRDKDATAVDHKLVLQILGELNDVEVVLLARKGKTDRASAKAFHDKHATVLDHVPPSFGDPPEAMDKDAMRTGMETHLERLGLLRLEPDVKAPHFGSRQPRKANWLGPHLAPRHRRAFRPRSAALTVSQSTDFETALFSGLNECAARSRWTRRSDFIREVSGTVS
jgi:hypothetical protein